MIFYCHPHNLEILKQQINVEIRKTSSYIYRPYDFKVYTDNNIPISKKTGWIPPKHKFIEYGPEDWWWLEYCNLGKPKEEMVIYGIREDMILPTMSFVQNSKFI